MIKACYNSGPFVTSGLFVPAQAGLGCHYWDRTARGGWIGLALDTPREDLARAVVEGIALRAAQLVGAFATASGVGRVSIDGGLSRSLYFTQFLANALGQQISVAESADLTAIGMLQLCIANEQKPAQVLLQWRQVEPDGVSFGQIHPRFADAVARMRGWTEAT